MLASALELLASGSELHCTGLHIGQLDLLDIADYIVFAIGFAMFVPFLTAQHSNAEDGNLKDGLLSNSASQLFCCLVL